MIINLIVKENYVELYAIATSNSFGDQFVEYVHEDFKGKKTYAFNSQSEGNWIIPSIKDFSRLKRFDYSGNVFWNTSNE